MRARTLLLGDWTRAIRDPVDVIRSSFPVGLAVSTAVEGHVTLGLAVATLVVWALRPIDLPQPYDLAINLAFVLTGWGDALLLYDRWALYDNVVHFLVPSFLAPVVYILLVRLDVLDDLREQTEPHHRIGIFLVTLSFGLAVGAIWEIFEWTADHAVGSNLVRSAGDTATDLLADGSGAAAGAVLLVVWSYYGWSTVRRVPDRRVPSSSTTSTESTASGRRNRPA